MTARIDGNQGSPISPHVDRAEAAVAKERAQSRTGGSARTDRVEVSEDAALINSAAQAASRAPAIRPDKVDAARRALAEGTLGADAGRLADALIDHMIGGGE